MVSQRKRPMIFGDNRFFNVVNSTRMLSLSILLTHNVIASEGETLSRLWRQLPS